MSAIVRRWGRLIAEVVVPATAWVAAVLVAPDPAHRLALPAIDAAPLPATTPPLAERAYVWQRAWDDRVRKAVGAHAPSFDGVVALAVEVRLDASGLASLDAPIDAWCDADWAALRGVPGAVALAVRIAPYRGGLPSRGPAPAALEAVVRRVRERAAAHDLDLDEIQLDFDAAESQLAGYAGWIALARRAAHPARLSVTALPSWLDGAAFAAIAEASDRFVLQVHGLERPRRADALPRVCDTIEARRWIDRAASFGRPFEVALPTYGYRVASAPDGRVVAVEAESPRRDWPRGTRVAVVEADAGSIAGLVGALRERRPDELVGISWYRLPVEGDRLNWPWTTLARVRTGARPATGLRIEVRRGDDGVDAVAVVNEGDVPSPLPARIELLVESPPPRERAALSPSWLEPLGPYAIERAPGARAAVLRLHDTAQLDRLAPGERLTVAWSRSMAVTGGDLR